MEREIVDPKVEAAFNVFPPVVNGVAWANFNGVEPRYHSDIYQ
jgi:hypothetical protein